MLSITFGIFLVVIELCARSINTKVHNKSEIIKEEISREFDTIKNFSTELNMSEDELHQLAVEYNEHVWLCVTHYGNWSIAIKTIDSMHMPDYQGKYLNVAHGLRVTTNAPTATKKRLYIFGGSTVFCGEVKDSLTICSQLQDFINIHQSTTSVVNFGRHGSTFRNRVLYLERCDLLKDDIVIFWFGVNELGWKLLEGKTDVPFWIHLFHRFSEGLNFFSKYLALLEIISKSFDAFVLRPFYKIYAFIETKNSLIKLDQMAKLRGFKYKVILQPNLLTKQFRTQREDIMQKFFLSRDKGKIIKDLFEANYPKFRRLLSRFNGADGTDIFAQTDQEVFVDWIHLNSVGNQIAAKFIFQVFEADGLFENS